MFPISIIDRNQYSSIMNIIVYHSIQSLQVFSYSFFYYIHTKNFHVLHDIAYIRLNIDRFIEKWTFISDLQICSPLSFILNKFIYRASNILTSMFFTKYFKIYMKVSTRSFKRMAP